jgi:hypothetical protein
MKKLLILFSFFIAALTVGAQHGTFTDVRIINGDSTISGTNNGTIFYNRVSNKFRFRQNGVWVSLGTGSGGAWGSITGTLSAQTDLNTALGLKAPLASPTFTGTVIVPTAATGDNSTKAASTAFVNGRLARFFTTSEAGAVSDATITEGSSSYGTDNTTVLQTLLDQASAGPIVIMWDGKYSVSATLKIRGNTTIIATSKTMGIIARVNMNADVFKNYNETASSSTHTDQNIEIYNLFINGNGGQQSTQHTQADGWISNVRFTGADHVRFEGVSSVNPRNFGYWVMNCNYVDFQNVTYDYSPTYAPSQNLMWDGIHINGPAKYITVTNYVFKSGDDGIGTNADDLFQSSSYPGTTFNTTATDYDPYATSGEIAYTRYEKLTAVTGCKFGLRFLSTVSALHDVVVDGFDGLTQGQALIVDNWFDGTPAAPGNGNFYNLTFRNFSIQVTTGQAYKLCYYALGGNIKNILFENITRNDFTASTYPLWLPQQNANIDNLTINNYQQVGGVTSLPALAGGGHIKNLSFNGVKITGLESGNTSISAPLVQMTSGLNGSIERLQISDSNTDWINNLVDYSYGFIDNIELVNIIQTNVTAAQGTVSIGSGRTIKELAASAVQSPLLVSGSGSVTSTTSLASTIGSNTVYNFSQFTGANGTAFGSYTPDTGGTWTLLNSSTWEIQSNRGVPKTPAPASNLWMAIASAGFTDMIVTADVTKNVFTSGVTLRMIVKYTDINNYIAIDISSTTGSCALQNVVAGVATSFGSFTAGFTSDIIQHRVKVTAVSTAIAVYFDDKLIGSGTSGTTQTGTSAGIGCFGTASAPSVFTFDNYKVVSPTYSGYGGTTVSNYTLAATAFTFPTFATNRTINLIQNSSSNNFANLTLRPSTGSSVSGALAVQPIGTPSIRADINLFNTDFFTDGTNYEDLLFRAAGSEYQIGSIKGGSGTVRPFWFDATGSLSSATSNLLLNTNGTSTFHGSVTISGAGNGLGITEGTNGKVGQTTLVSGTKAITISGVTTSSRALVQLVTPTGTTLTTTYQAVCTSNTLTIQANVAAGTINTADGSVLNYFIIN